jgi:cell division septum initiation protein DivIVA
MTALSDIDTGVGTTRPSGEPETAPGTEPVRRSHPNVSGDLPTVFRAAPMFRRTVAGYDRFQVDTYVQWAEDELATADREREHLLARHLRTRADLDEARELLAHSPGGGDFLQLSRRIGAMLAAAADEAESMRAVAQADRRAAAAEAERMLAEAAVRAERVTTEAATEARETIAEAGRIVDQAERTAGEARAEAAARLEEVRMIEQRTAEYVQRIRQQAMEQAVADRLQARDEIVRMLGTGREERRRTDAAAAATRADLDRDAATRRASLLAEVEALEHRRSALRAEVELLADRLAGTTGDRLDAPPHRLLDRLRSRARSLRAPSATNR